jgi:ATP-dependent RNA circularization protein (DNA/RNA ligase family)
MSDSFVKFPSTPHLIVLGETAIRDDKVLTESERDLFLSREIVVEEKVDGANLGVSFTGDGVFRCQNRGDYISEPYSGQWKGLGTWLDHHRDALFDVLTDQYIVFGEWCRVVHSVCYDRLPDWFLGFDVYDRQAGSFLDLQERNRLMAAARLATVPALDQGQFNLAALQAMLGRSRFGSVHAEGLYLRNGESQTSVQRAKLVHPAFVQAIHEHWLRKELRYNRLVA